jgi:hypothetical protein
VEPEVVETSMDCVRGPVHVASDVGARDQADGFTEIPVLKLAPGLLAASDLDSCRCPRLPKGLEVPQDRVQRRIWPSTAMAASTVAVPAREPVPFLRGYGSDAVVLVEPAQSGDDALAGPPGTRGSASQSNRRVVW